MNRAALVAASSALSAMSLAAQVFTTDAGSFTISRSGIAVGREEFTIQASVSGVDTLFIAQATISLDSLRLLPALRLRTDEHGAPSQYQIEVRTGATTIEFLKGQLARGRFSEQVQTPRGESVRELVASPGAQLLDDDVFHQYFFLARERHRGQVPIIIPRRSAEGRNAQVVMRVEESGRESVTVGGRSLAARHLTLRASDEQRDVWVDDAGRVLRVELPKEGLVAVRDDPPR
jgi:hypothetical protein